MVSQNFSRRRLLAGVSLVALSLSSVPALACTSNPGSVNSSVSSVCWSSGNLTVTNTGTISGAESGVGITGSNPSGVLTNSGSISGSQAGIISNGTIGTLTNAIGGTIAGTSYGIGNNGSIGTLTNSGTIGGGVAGIWNDFGTITALTNNSGGTISGNSIGIENTGSSTIGTLTNSGAISGGSTAIYNGGTITTLTNSGTISGVFSGIINDGTIGALTNESSGTISGRTGIDNGGTITTLTNSGTIVGGAAGIYNDGSISTLTNSGSISGSGGAGIHNDGTITTLTNSGSISGDTYGISNDSGTITALTNDSGDTISGRTVGIINSGTIGTLTNSGMISGTITNGVGIKNEGTITALTNDSGGTISGNSIGIGNNGGTIGALTNNGTISGGSVVGIYSDGSIGTLTNNGAISGDTYGIYNDTAGTIGALTNNGTISGDPIGIGNYGTITALTNDSGGTISGGRTGIDNDSSSTISALTNNGSISGGQFGIYNKGTITTLTNGSGGTISGASSYGIYNDGTIGTLTNSGAISGSGLGINNDGGSIGALTNSGTISGNVGIWNDTDGTIGTLTNESGGTISGNSVAVYNDGTITALINESDGTISSNSSAGIYNNAAGSIGALTNSGTISGIVGISNSGTIGALTNESSSTISGTDTGIDNYNTIGTLTNSGAISGNVTGIFNTGTLGAGSIGALTNNGTISGGTYGIGNRGTIGTLNNSGTISGGGYGIYNGGTPSTPANGTIGTLTNSGTISGPTAIYNGSTSTLGPIVNSGIIAGNIVNDATQELTIDGGSGTIFGTLTGATGSISSAAEGTITNTSSNVVFDTGNILLNDAINVGANAVIVNSATIAVANPVSISGNYQQTGGGLVARAASATSYGQINVSGNATVANAAVVIEGSGLTGGNSFTIVLPQGSGSYTGDTVSVIGTNGLTGTIQSTTGDLVVTLAGTPDQGGGSGSSNPDTFTSKGQAAGGIAAALGSVLDQINGSNTPAALAFQNDVLVPLALLPASQQGQAIKELAPVQSTSQAIGAATTTVLNVVEQHQQTAMAYSPETGEAAGSALRGSAVWAQMLGGGASQGSTAAAAGYNSSEFGLTAGMDHLFTPNVLGGVAVSWLRSWSQGIDSASGQSATLDSYQLTFYGTYRYGRAFIDGQLGAGWNQFNQSRAIAFLGQTATSGYDGQQYLASAELGYDLPVGGPGNLTVTPLAGLRWLHADNGAYTESGAGAADLSVNAQSFDSVTQELGVKGSWHVATALGVVEPELTAAWLHDYTNAPIPTSGVMGGEAFAVTTPRIAADGASIGVAATLLKSDHLSFRLEYDGDLRAGYQSHTGLLKALWNF